jgi:cytochrome c2
MEQNLTNNEEVMEKVTEVTEEVVKAAPKSGFGRKVAGYGLAVVAGCLLCHYVIEPTATKIGGMIEKHKNKKTSTDGTVPIDGDFKEFDDDEFDDEPEGK